MFTGIVEAVGVVQRCVNIDGGRSIWVKGAPWVDELHVGDSVAVDGACLHGGSV